MKKMLKYIKCWLILRFPFLEKEWLTEEQQERLSIARLRAHLAFFGHDVSDMTDDEIKEGMINMGKLMSQTGLSLEEVERASVTMCKILKGS